MPKRRRQDEGQQPEAFVAADAEAGAELQDASEAKRVKESDENLAIQADGEGGAVADEKGDGEQGEDDGNQNDNENDGSEDGSGDEDGDDEGDDNEEEDDDASSDEPVEKKVLPQRGTRGKRMGKLVGEAAEADEQFWGQSAWDEGSDEEFSESDVSDATSESTDSDIDLPEEEADGEARVGGGKGKAEKPSRGGVAIVDDDDEGGRGKGKAGAGGKGGGKAYVDRGISLTKGIDLAAAAAMGGAAAAAKGRRAAAKAGGAGSSSDTGVGPDSAVSPGAAAAIAAVSRALRASTQDSHEAAEARRKADEAAAKIAAAKAEPPAPPVPRMSQAEVLVDAAHTTIDNLRSLEALQAMDAERQAQDALAVLASGRGHAFPVGVPLLRSHSKRGCPDTITFTEVDDFPSSINATRVSAQDCECQTLIRHCSLTLMYRTLASQRPTVIVSHFLAHFHVNRLTACRPQAVQMRRHRPSSQVFRPAHQAAVRGCCRLQGVEGAICKWRWRRRGRRKQQQRRSVCLLPVLVVILVFVATRSRTGISSVTSAVIASKNRSRIIAHRIR